MLSYPATIPLSSRTLNHLAERIRAHRQQRRSRWRRLDPGRQALLWRICVTVSMKALLRWRADSLRNWP